MLWHSENVFILIENRSGTRYQSGNFIISKIIGSKLDITFFVSDRPFYEGRNK